MSKPLQLTAPLEKTLPLEATDQLFDCAGTTVTIRQATQAQHEKREELWETHIREVRAGDEEDGNIRYVQKFSVFELMRMEAFLTVVESNILDSDGSMLFRRGMNEKDFATAWGKLPRSTAEEIHGKVLEVNVDWRRPN